MQILPWLAVPETYWAIAICSITVWTLQAVSSTEYANARWRFYDRTIFVVLTLTTLIALRWPLLSIPRPLNPDEAQMGAQALKAAVDALPWHGFDGSTGGPIDSYVLMLPILFGAAMSFAWIHLIATLLGVATICAFAAGAEALCGIRIARAAAVVPLAFFALMQDNDFWHYSSELMPVLLASISLAILAHERARGTSRAWLAVAGVCLALMPFAKLQTTPMAAYIAVLFAVVLLRSREHTAASRARQLVFAGALFGTVVAVVAAVAASGSVQDAYISYVAVGLSYAEHGNAVGLRFFFAATPGYTPFALGTFALLVGVAVAALGAKPTPREWENIAALVGLVVVSVVSIIAPHRPFPHYLTLLVVPIAALIAVLMTAAMRQAANRPDRAQGRQYLPIVFCTLAVLLPTTVAHVSGGNPFLGLVTTRDVPDDPVVRALRSDVARGATMAVWGWMPHYYVYTGTRMATKDAVTYYQIVTGKYRDYYRSRYLANFLEHPPDIFVDAVAPASFVYTNRAQSGFETFPELREIIDRNYILVSEINGVRIYRQRRRR